MKRKRICLALLIAMILSAPVITGCKGPSGEEGSGRDAAEQIKYDSSEFLASVPEWNGQPYCEINGNVPEFREDEIWKTTQESLDPLDSLGRCGTANSCIGLDGMPDHERGDISDVHPTGWHKGSYAFIEGGSLYNRSHLIAYSLSGDEAIDRNLITGTSYMNRDGMNPFEISIAEYVRNTGNHVMYRVEPCFMGDELVARGEFRNLGGLVYFTDGWGTYPEWIPGYKVAFAFYDEDRRCREVPPWAMQIILDSDTM